MADITYLIESKSGKKTQGTISWPAKQLKSRAISGPFGEGSLPIGNYTAPRAKLLDKTQTDSSGAYCDKKNKCWMQVISPTFETDRTDLGIHPDGNVPGTEGCIGLQPDDTKAWYQAFFTVPSDGTTSIAVIDGTKSLSALMDLPSFLKTTLVVPTDREPVVPLGVGPEIAEISMSNPTLNDLPFSVTRAYDLDVTAALSLSIPVAGSVTGGTERRVLVLERAAYRVERVTEQPKMEVQVGYAIRLCLTVNKKKFDGKLTLPFVTAAAQLGQVEAEWILQVAGLAGPKIDAVALAPTELNLETFVLAKQSLQQLITAIRDTSTVFIPVPIAVAKPPTT